ncbi:hypothetical protein ebA3181 [Aromatoleum aromaticum EbN1]|uniref:Uncharacterized protein n=1 Tax=Aromatoleum aromaticum (strain DSM 19018 / LMG 30748 / EbN1) TaxID=76114 RepID=Q5P450_AROAE|nr:hypothetical protein ebA3181 [Aromatoleum aromaticum EbN1]
MDADRIAESGSVRLVEAVGELERQRVLSGWELERGFRLALAEMQVRGIGRHWFAGFDRLAIDDEVMMPGAFGGLARRLHAHALDAHLHREFLGHRCTVGGRDEISAIGRRRKRRQRCGSGKNGKGKNSFHGGSPAVRLQGISS